MFYFGTHQNDLFLFYFVRSARLNNPANNGQPKKLEERITLIYQNLGSFTFSLAPSVPLVKPNEWLVTYSPEEGVKEQYRVMLEFRKNRVDVHGSGTTEDG